MSLNWTSQIGGQIWPEKHIVFGPFGFLKLNLSLQNRIFPLKSNFGLLLKNQVLQHWDSISAWCDTVSGSICRVADSLWWGIPSHLQGPRFSHKATFIIFLAAKHWISNPLNQSEILLAFLQFLWTRTNYQQNVHVSFYFNSGA